MATTAGGAHGPDTTARTVTATPTTVGRPVGRPGPRPRGGRGPDGPSAVPSVRRLRAPRRRARGTLPARLRLLRTAILLLTAVCAGLMITAGLAASDTWSAVTGHHAPRTASASGLNLALNDMDAQAVNSLLANGDAGKGRMTVPYDKAIQLYDEAREAVSRDLRTLGVAAEGDTGAERTVERVTADFARYQEFIGRALESDTRTGGKAEAIENYRTANDLLTQRILPEARSLVDATDRQFEDAYDTERSGLGTQAVLLVALGVALLAVLALLQWYLAHHFHRILNPGLLAATACALLAVVLGSQALTATSEDLRIARHDAFDSVVALSRARAIAYDANADESRYLLDRDHRTAHEAAFLAKSQSLYGMTGADLSSYGSRLGETWEAYREDHEDKRFTGEFRRELDNITFPGERAAAERTVEAYAVYQRDDHTVRSLVTVGREQEAVAFCISWEPGKSNAHFGAWMKALDEVTAVNSRAFDAAAGDGRDALTGRLPRAVGGLLVAAVLAVLGLRPRLAEFR